MRCYGTERYNLATTMMDEEDEGDSEDEDVDMPSLLPCVVNADESDRIITHDYSADGLSKKCLQERLMWDWMARHYWMEVKVSPVIQMRKQNLIAI